MKIYIILATLCIVAAFGFTHYKLTQYERIINTQGSVIQIMLETPAINAAVRHEVTRRQGISSTTTPQSR